MTKHERMQGTSITDMSTMMLCAEHTETYLKRRQSATLVFTIVFLSVRHYLRASLCRNVKGNRNNCHHKDRKYYSRRPHTVRVDTSRNTSPLPNKECFFQV
ncbi:hypothetical protein TNCV_2054161 [Trichonephila clavipes]|nr:hypothetical protein TNCV_2054161 [Trichonephila clavipes]